MKLNAQLQSVKWQAKWSCESHVIWKIHSPWKRPVQKRLKYGGQKPMIAGY